MIHIIVSWRSHRQNPLPWCPICTPWGVALTTFPLANTARSVLGHCIHHLVWNKPTLFWFSERRLSHGDSYIFRRPRLLPRPPLQNSPECQMASWNRRKSHPVGGGAEESKQILRCSLWHLLGGEEMRKVFINPPPSRRFVTSWTRPLRGGLWLGWTLEGQASPMKHFVAFKFKCRMGGYSMDRFVNSTYFSDRFLAPYKLCLASVTKLQRLSLFWPLTHLTLQLTIQHI